MPGIFGLITNRARSLALADLRAMLATLHHEPFYTSGIWSDEGQGVYMGWVARRGSFAEPMPVHNERRDTTLAFAGEEFPEPGLREALKARGHAVEPAGPDYLVHRYEGEADFPKGLNGRFHGLVVDGARGAATLFNDRFGLQRIYYHQAEDAFYFAAEAKAILAVRPELRDLDPRGVGEYIACGCVLENRTLFRGIHVLPPGSAWVFRGGRLEKKAAYFGPREWEEQEPLGAEEYYRQLRDAFTAALPRYFAGSEKIGVSLTGGLDTRIIMAWRKAEPGTLPCYTFGSAYRDNQDVKLARRVAEMCGQPHQVIPVGKEFLGRFSHYAERSLYLTDGCVDLSRSPDLYVNEAARRIAPVRMVGTYGSEILRGVVMFKPEEPAAGVFAPEIVASARIAAETYFEARRAHPATFVAFRQSPWCHYGVLTLEQTQVGVRAPYLDNTVVRAVFRAPRGQDEDVRLRLIREGARELARLRTDRGAGARGPSGALLRAYLEFTFKAEYAYDYGMPQWIARVDHALAPLHLEKIWLGRHKVVHFRIWYRTVLAGYVREILLAPRSLARPYVERRAVEAIVSAHLKGHRNYTTEINRLLSLELLHRLFVDGDAMVARGGNVPGVAVAAGA